MWDALASGETFQGGAVHELLSLPRSPLPTSLALRLGWGAQGDAEG